MTDHTPEPWRVKHKDVKAHVFAEHIGMDCHVATAFGPNPARVEDIEDIANANAARIVACVNACAGIPTEQLGGVSVADWLHLLKFCEEQIGWKGDRGQHPNAYACEHCAAPPELDFEDLKHEQHCVVLKIRAALAPFRKD